MYSCVWLQLEIQSAAPPLLIIYILLYATIIKINVFSSIQTGYTTFDVYNLTLSTVYFQAQEKDEHVSQF